MKKIYLLLIFTSFLIAGCQNDDLTDNLVKWDGTTATVFDTNSEPFIISSPAQLKLLSDIVNGLNTNPPLGATDSSRYELVRGIDMNSLKWTPIGSEDSPFKGVFDGGNRTIKGIFIDTDQGFQGLFGSIDSAIVKKINLAECHITAGDYIINNDNNGGIVGYCKNGIIEECTFSGILNNNGSAAGGIVGKVEGSNARISSCSNLGVIESSQGIRIGGIVGFNMYGLINDCSNSGIVSGPARYIGGIAGQNYNVTMRNCFNSANISGTFLIGGLVGVNMTSLVSNCFNTGDISGYTDENEDIGYGAYIGGIAGSNDGTLINCYNAGNINTPSLECGSRIGGVVGYNTSTTFSGITSTGIITNCYYLIACAKDGKNKIQNGVGIDTINTSVDDIESETNYFTETQGKASNGNTEAKIGKGQYNTKSALVDCLNAWQSANTTDHNRWTLSGSKTGYPVFVGK